MAKSPNAAPRRIFTTTIEDATPKQARPVELSAKTLAEQAAGREALKLYAAAGSGESEAGEAKE